ncbi:DUF805 domain-containing protein [uncultured Methylobacterium sp.]|jgi:uncharacterized membrane protein YhaH (DUF805 family)|uniref:DUF805 domain-containing protein n=1 Tax=uncultured Methylobacterium sp. TaxID=157278 RepID=UPI00260D3588|nr:DUF805 domain-containing protein [uncultured Methylobacterium sp.]
MTAYLSAMRRYGVFEGRASRGEYWWFMLALGILTILALIVDGAIPQESVSIGGKQEPGGIITGLVLLGHIVPALTLTVRRLHDTGRSGWLVLINFIPLGALVILIFMLTPGQAGPNRYGPNPLTGAGPAGANPRLAVPVLEAASQPPVSERRDVIAEIERLGRLRREGHLSEAEFEVMKAEALAQHRGA